MGEKVKREGGISDKIMAKDVRCDAIIAAQYGYILAFPLRGRWIAEAFSRWQDG